MRLVLNLQAFPGAAQSRNIGDYGASVARAIVRHGGHNDVRVVVNYSSAATLEELQDKYPDLVQGIDSQLVRIPSWENSAAKQLWRRGASELLREHALVPLKPDAVLCCALGGTPDSWLFSKLRLTNCPMAIACPKELLRLHSMPGSAERSHLNSSVAQGLRDLRTADLVLVPSEYFKRSILDTTKLELERLVVIPWAVHEYSSPGPASHAQERVLRERLSLNRDFLMAPAVGAQEARLEPLIEAYAMLPGELRSSHQLLLAGALDDLDVSELHRFAGVKGLRDNDVILTGELDPNERAALYSTCTLFVLPFFSEGFVQLGLEAMSCNAPVIGADSADIPELIGLSNAVFDAESEAKMSEKIRQVLSSVECREHLRANAGEQARTFSSQEIARRALDALGALRGSNEVRKTRLRSATRRPAMAYVSPLPPERSGVADYSRELLPELAKYYKIDLITDLGRSADPDLRRRFRFVPFARFRKTAHRYERILYHVGNSPFHSQIPSLLERYPGTLVLHDFFLSHLFYYLDGIDRVALWRTLYDSHGYPGLLARSQKGAEAAVWTYPCNLAVLSHAEGVIVHSEQARQLGSQWFGMSTDGWKIIPQLRKSSKNVGREEARKALGISPDVFMACCFGFVAPTKLNDLVLRSWMESGLANRDDCRVVFVGGDGEGKPYRVNGVTPSGVVLTGYVSKEVYERYLAAADVGVQLRGELSRGETPRSVLDCMAHGLATIVNPHPGIDDIPAECVAKLSGNTSSELAAVFERLWRDSEYRAELGRLAEQYVRDKRTPALIAQQYAQTVEEFARDHPTTLKKQTILGIASLRAKSRPSDADLGSVAACLAENSGANCGIRQLFVDVTVLFSLGDYQTGIHRVTRAVLAQLLENPPAGYRVEPVFRPYRQTYRYARTFTSKVLALEGVQLEDAPLAVNPGDVFLGLDWDPGIDDIAADWLLGHRRRGMRTAFVIYDLLPLRRSDWFKPEMDPVFRAWIAQICRLADSCVCISRAVADDLADWLDSHPPASTRILDISYFHLGSDLESSWMKKGLSVENERVLEALTGREVLAMIGTVEPRKGHSQVLSAFERLWAEGETVRLVICGKQGWMVESIAQQLRSHPEMGKRLFWMDQAGDEALLRLYTAASGMLMASEGEGFGLPLIEAAQHHSPIIARDLPVFREIAGEHAFYFSGTAPEDLADALRAWLRLYRRGEHPRSDGMQRLTWEESTRQLLQTVLAGKIYKRWHAEGAIDRSAAIITEGRQIRENDNFAYSTVKRTMNEATTSATKSVGSESGAS